MRLLFYIGVLTGFAAFLLISHIVIESAPPQTSWEESDAEEGLSQRDLINLSEKTCRSIQEQLLRDQCYYDFAARDGSPSICTYIYDSIKKQMCMAASQREPALCMELQLAVSRDKCMQDLAYAAGDASACVYISNQEEKDWCHYILANKLKDISLCAPIRNPERMQKCRANIESQT